MNTIFLPDFFTQSTQVDIHVVNGSLDEPFQSRLSRKIDIILFNPPYVPTSEEEAAIAQSSRDIGGAWAGGSDGMLITNVLLQRIEVPLSILRIFPWLIASSVGIVVTKRTILSRCAEAK